MRAVAMEYPADEAVRNLDDEYFFGKDLLVCPLTLEDGTSREVYLPAGIWYNFFTGEKIEGGKNIIMQADWNEMLVFAREGVVILLAKPNLSITKDIVFEITIKKFGSLEVVNCMRMILFHLIMKRQQKRKKSASSQMGMKLSQSTVQKQAGNIVS